MRAFKARLRATTLPENGEDNKNNLTKTNGDHSHKIEADLPLKNTITGSSSSDELKN